MTHAASPPAHPRPVREALIAFVVATAVASLLFQIGRFVPLIAANLQALIAVAFIYVPVHVAHRNREDLSVHGFTMRPAGRSLLFAGVVLAVVFPLFLIGFVLFYRHGCAIGLGPLTPRGLCLRFGGWAALGHPRLPPEFLSTAFAQVVVVALPEELFFRGYVLHRLEQGWPPRRRWLGGGLGRALVVSSLLFALCHVLVDGDPRRLAVFFPGLLFGWLRSATGSIFAGVVTHAAANLYIDALTRTFLS